MKLAIQKGFSFGLTSGVITTLGLMVGLYSGTASRAVVLGGILTIAVADALSDALGMHMSEESESDDHDRVWTATIATFVAKLLFALTFAVPVLLFSLKTAVIVSIIWGLLILTVISYRLARSRRSKPYNVIFEHLSISILVIVITYFVGEFVAAYFK